MRYAIIVGLALWFLFGDPLRTFAGWFWDADAAPWEQVDAFYYPSSSNLLVYDSVADVGSVRACRSVVQAIATSKGDPNIERGDYECGVAPRFDKRYGMAVYRLTIR